MTHGIELSRRVAGLSEEVRWIILRWHEWHLDFEILDHVANKEVATLDMFHAIMVLGVVRNVASTFTVGGEAGGPVLGGAEAPTGPEVLPILQGKSEILE